MNCAKIQELLSAYFDGELTGRQRDEVSAHLNACQSCEKELAEFEKLSSLANAIAAPVPPLGQWSQLELELESAQRGNPADRQTIERPVRRDVWKTIGLTAAAVIVVAIGWLSVHSMFGHGDHDQFAADFGRYLDEFQRNPESAQQLLLAKYENQPIEPSKPPGHNGYRPAVARGLPEGYSLQSTHVMKMPCCDCVQSVCKRSDGTTLVIFEHDDEETNEWFGDRPEILVSCNEVQCRLVELDSHVAASWKRGSRYITLIGARDTNEISQMVAWLDAKETSLHN